MHHSALERETSQVRVSLAFKHRDIDSSVSDKTQTPKMSETLNPMRTSQLTNSTASWMEYCATVKNINQKQGSIFSPNQQSSGLLFNPKVVMEVMQTGVQVGVCIDINFLEGNLTIYQKL